MVSTAPLKKSPTWKYRWLKLILQKKLVQLEIWMASRYSSFQKKEWHTTLKNGRRQVVFSKNMFLRKFNATSRSLTIAVPKKYSIPKEGYKYSERAVPWRKSCSESHSYKCKCLQLLFWKIYYPEWVAATAVVKLSN